MGRNAGGGRRGHAGGGAEAAGRRFDCESQPTWASRGQGDPLRWAGSRPPRRRARGIAFQGSTGGDAAMSFARFIVAVDDQWNVTVTQNDVPIGSARQMVPGPGGKRTWPQAPASEQAALKAEGRNLDPIELDNILDRITRRTPKKNEVALLGAHLFDGLLGAA